jgi:hypothetical protein
MDPPKYQVLLSKDVKEQLRTVIARASDYGQKDEALHATRKIFEGLTWLADELGESRSPLKVLGELRVVVIGPVGAVFSVNRARHEVIVGRFRLLGLHRD